jgi:hypothetical protein
MRRTLLSVLVAVGSFVVTAAVLVGVFQLVAGSSPKPVQGSSARSSSEPSAPVDAPPASSSGSPASSAPASPGVAPSPVASASADEIEPPLPTAGVLSEDFKKLGLDDPTTTLDESVRSACDVVDDVPLAGETLCGIVR